MIRSRIVLLVSALGAALLGTALMQRPERGATLASKTGPLRSVRSAFRGVAFEDGPLAAPTNYRATFAVIIGIDRYPGGASRLPPLLFATRDASAVHDVLRDEYGYRPERICFLQDGQATRAGIRAAFERWLPNQGLRPDDAVFVFFAGHGLTDAKTGEGLLAAVDSSADEASTSCVPVKWLRDRLKLLPCRHKLIVLDSCYSGALFKREARPAPGKRPEATAGRGAAWREEIPARDNVDNISYYLSQPAFCGLSAGRYGPVADGLGKAGHSVFTTALLQVLRERADSPRADGAFTFRQLAAEVEGRVFNAHGSRQVPNSGRLTDGDGDYVFRPTLRRLTPRQWASRERYARALSVARDLCEAGNIEPARVLLESQVPHDGRPDLRGWEWHYLWRRCHGDLLTLRGHAGPVSALAYAPDGLSLATGGADGTIRLWDSSSGRELAHWQAHPEGVANLAFAPDGKSLASGGTRDGTVKRWDLATDKELSAYRLVNGARVTGRIASLAYTPDGKTLAVALRRQAAVAETPMNGKVVLLDSATGKERLLSPRSKERPDFVACALSPDGLTLATASRGAVHGIGLWRVSSGEELALLRPEGDEEEGGLGAVAFAPDGKTVLGRGVSSWLRWSLETKRPVPSLAVADARELAFAPDGTTFAAPGAHGALALYGADGKALRTLLGHADRIARLAFSPDGKRIATASLDGTARIWSARERPEEQRLPFPKGSTGAGDPAGVAFSPDSQRLASIVRTNRGGRDPSGETISVQDVREGVEVGRAAEPSGPIEDVRFSPAGRWLAYALNRFDPKGREWSGAVKLRTVPGTVEETHVLPGWHGEVEGLAFSADGRFLAAGGGRLHPPASPRLRRPGEAKIWDLATRRTVATLPASAETVHSQAFSADGKWVATTDEAPAASPLDVRVWDTAGKRQTVALSGHPGSVWGLTFSADGRRLLTNSAGRWDREADRSLPDEARVWDVATGREIATLLPADTPQRAVLAPDGSRVALVSGRNEAHAAWLWDVQGGSVRRIETRADSSIRNVAFSRDGKRLLTLARQHSESEKKTPPPTPSPERRGGKTDLLAPLSVSGRGWGRGFFHTHSEKHRQDSVQVLDEAGRALFGIQAAGVAHAALSADGRRLVTAFGDEGTLKVWDLDKKTTVALGEPLGVVQDVRFSPDGKWVASLAVSRASGAPVVRLWDAAGKLAGTFAEPAGPGGRQDATIRFTGDSEQLVVLSALLRRATFREVASERARHLELRGHTGEVTHVVLSADGRRVASGGGGEVKLWDAQTGQELLSVGGLEHGVGDLALAPDGGLLAFAPAEIGKRATVPVLGEVKIWDRETGKWQRTLHGHEGRVLRLAFGPDSRRLATAGADGTVRVWDVETGEELRRKQGHRSAVWDVAFSPDGERLVSAGHDGLVKVWDALTGQLLLMLPGRGGPRPRVAFSPDGTRLATMAPDGGLIVWKGQLSAEESAGREQERPRRGAEELAAGQQGPGAAQRLRTLIDSDPGNGMLYALRGHSNADLGRWGLAIGDYQRAIDRGFAPPLVWDRLARAQLHRTKVDTTYRKTCARLLDFVKRNREPWAAHRAAWTCALRPGAVTNPDEVVELATFAQARKAELPWRPRFLDPHACVRGAALYRAGRFEEAVRELEGAVERLGKTGIPHNGGTVLFRGGTAYEWLFLAMTHQRLGQPDKAVGWLTRSGRWFEAARKVGPDGQPPVWFRLPWDQRLELDLLRREAEMLVNGTGGAGR